MTEFTDFLNYVLGELKASYKDGKRVYPHLIIVRNKKRLWFNLKNAPSYISPMDAAYPLITRLYAEMFIMFSEVWVKAIYTKEEMLGTKNLRYGDVSRFSDRIEGLVVHGAALTGEKKDMLFSIITENGRVKGLKEDEEIPQVSSPKLPYSVNGKWIEYEKIPGYDIDGMAKKMESELD
jgi:hypothetical protein